jgi:hypothetical protein
VSTELEQRDLKKSATVTAKRMVAGGRKIEVAVLRITQAGRKVLNEGNP